MAGIVLLGIADGPGQGGRIWTRYWSDQCEREVAGLNAGIGNLEKSNANLEATNREANEVLRMLQSNLDACLLLKNRAKQLVCFKNVTEPKKVK